MRNLQSLVLATALALIQPAVQAGGDIDAGKAKSAPCAACHGVDGNSPSTAFPILAGQYADYLVRAMEDYATGNRSNPIMAPMAATLSDQDREDLAAYFSSQKSNLYTVEYSDEMASQ